MTQKRPFLSADESRSRRGQFVQSPVDSQPAFGQAESICHRCPPVLKRESIDEIITAQNVIARVSTRPAGAGWCKKWASLAAVIKAHAPLRISGGGLPAKWAATAAATVKQTTKYTNDTKDNRKRLLA